MPVTVNARHRRGHKMGRNVKTAINVVAAIAAKADDAVDVSTAAPPVKAPNPEPPTKVADNTENNGVVAVGQGHAGG